jgi:hypothetical protein
MNLPHYILEKIDTLWFIWDTVNHEYIGKHFDTKESAESKLRILK